RRHFYGEVVCTDSDPEVSDLSGPGVGTVAYSPRTLKLAEEGTDLGDEEYDLVIFAEVIEHLTFHPFATLHSINRCLKRGGKLILTTPNLSSWKKIWLMMRGDHPHDSGTFAGAWGH